MPGMHPLLRRKAFDKTAAIGIQYGKKSILFWNGLKKEGPARRAGAYGSIGNCGSLL